MGGPKFSLKVSILLFLCLLTCGRAQPSTSYVRDACSVTTYQSLCIHSLASFSHFAKQSPSRWARVGVSVALGKTKAVARFIGSLKKSGRFSRRTHAALSDCMECFSNAIDELHMSLGVLRRLSASNFETQMGDLTTWLSAALTDEGTCLDGFEEQGGKYVGSLKSHVLKASCMTSNSLALVNKLASSGLDSATSGNP